MKKIRPVFKCWGGKSYLWEWILSKFPKNFNKMTYVEGCGGACSILLNKPKSDIEVYNDADPAIANIFFHLTNNAGTFIEQVKTINYSEEAFNEAQLKCHETNLEGAVAELVVRRMSRGGLRKAFSWSERLRGGRPGDLNAFETYKDHLELIVNRLKDVKVECRPVIDLIDNYDSANTLFYIDPPYLPSTRQANDVYAFEMSEKDHIELLEKVNNTHGKVVISGYLSKLYEKYLKGWKMYCQPIANHSSQAKQKEKRVEVLWCNYK